MIKKERISSILGNYGVWFLLVALIIIMSFLDENFLTTSNIISVLRQCAPYAILAFGIGFVVIAGGIDLSGGAVIAFSSCVVALLMVKSGLNMWFAVFLAIIAGGLCGLVNGFVISKLKVPFFLTTVAMMYLARGTALVLTKENSITGLPESFAIFGGTGNFLIPPQVIIAAIVFVILYIVLNHTKVGRYTYALGSSAPTAKLSGINIDRYTIMVYTISGICAGIAGITMAARMKTGSPIIAESMHLDSICAVAIGGVSMKGGSGRLSNIIAGALVLTIIKVGLNMLGIASSTQQIIMGALIIIVVAVDMRKK